MKIVEITNGHATHGLEVLKRLSLKLEGDFTETQIEDIQAAFRQKKDITISFELSKTVITKHEIFDARGNDGQEAEKRRSKS